jgi:hypothetical protein
MNKNPIDRDNRQVKCAVCVDFFVTHRPNTPWGCRRFNVIPSLLVFSTTGTKCAYFKERSVGFRGKGRSNV